MPPTVPGGFTLGGPIPFGGITPLVPANPGSDDKPPNAGAAGAATSGPAEPDTSGLTVGETGVGGTAVPDGGAMNDAVPACGGGLSDGAGITGGSGVG